VHRHCVNSIKNNFAEGEQQYDCVEIQWNSGKQQKSHQRFALKNHLTEQGEWHENGCVPQSFAVCFSLKSGAQMVKKS
jgi:hypothetical protein